MFEILPTNVSGHYSEIPQTNPIRYEILFLEGNTLIPQTLEFKCKDFLNDVVSHLHGVPVSIYGFSTATLKLNEEEIWFRLTHLRPEFLKNWETVYAKDLGVGLPQCKLTPLDDTTCLLVVPKWYFETTYRISLLFHVIRGCNYSYSYKNFEEMFFNKASPVVEELVNGRTNSALLEWRLDKLPEELSEFVWWYSSDINSQTNKSSTYIHNCGWQTWISRFYKEEEECEDF